LCRGRPFFRFVNVQADDVPKHMAVAEQDISNLMRDADTHNPMEDADGTISPFEISKKIADAAAATTATMRYLLLAVACVSLIVGGIGIMNIMLVSVTERTREIGIRMAVGAHGSDIRMQFLIEAVVLSLMGGLLGILMGVSGSKFLSWYNHWPTLISTVAIVSAVIFSGAVGICFGYYPRARRRSSTRSRHCDTSKTSGLVAEAARLSRNAWRVSATKVRVRSHSGTRCRSILAQSF